MKVGDIFELASYGEVYYWTITKIVDDEVHFTEQPKYGQPNDFNDVFRYTIQQFEQAIKTHSMKLIKRIYLSGPMSICKDEATWRANFKKYEDIFTEKGYIVVNPANNEIRPTYEECLKHSLQQEMECDCIFFLPNSILSTGARLEYEIAKACGIEIILLDEDISFTDNYENNSGIKSLNSK